MNLLYYTGNFQKVFSSKEGNFLGMKAYKEKNQMKGDMVEGTLTNNAGEIKIQGNPNRA